MKILLINNCNECRYWGRATDCNHPEAVEKYPIGPDRDGFGIPKVCPLDDAPKT